MLKKSYAIMIVTAVLSALVLTGCYRTPEKRAEYMVKRMASELGLNDAQTAQLEKIKEEFFARRPVMAKLREETVREANELMRSAEVDKTKLNALQEKSQTGANDMVRFVFAKLIEIHDMLTPEQREKLAKYIEEHVLPVHH